MPHFTDSTGRTWRIVIDATSAQRVREATGVRLWPKPTPEVCFQLSRDPERIVRVLWCLVEPQAQALGVEPEQFGHDLGGDVIVQATDALCAALTKLFPRRHRRALLSVED